MKITDIKVSIVSVPFRVPESWRFGRVWGVTNVIVEVETDEGVVGFGEAPGNPAVKVIAEAIHTMSELLIGEDPRHITKLVRTIRARGWHHYPYIGNTAAAALEMAFWDIAGKVRGCPLYEFFGGLERNDVPFYWYLPVPDREPAQAAEQALAGIERGFRTLYLKIGFDFVNDLAIARAIRDAVGEETALRLDANEAWKSHEALRALAAFEELALEFCEQPIDMYDIEGLAFLRSQTHTPIGANQTAWLSHNVLDILRHRAADVIVTDPHQAGGLSAFRDVAGLCEIANIPLVKHSFGDLGITTAATLHLLGTLPEPALGHQTHLEILEHDLLSTPFSFAGGALAVPSGPGIGVELDREALAHYHKLYEEVGEFSGYAPLNSPSPLS